jgi:dihydroorotate dehydrogenase electron transfer subunit
VTVAAQAEPRTLAPPERRLARVTAVERLGAYHLIGALDDSGPANPRPGQFYMLAAGERWGGGADERPYLPRAFSYARARSAVHGEERGGREAHGVELDFLLEAIGPGTERLAALAPGDGLALVGPLGIGFRPPANGTRPLLVGGGIGTAPLVCLEDELLAGDYDVPGSAGTGSADGSDGRGNRPAAVLLGFRSAAHARAAALFSGRPALTTDDGSVGRRALVTELLQEELDADPAATVFACGPPAMLEAVRSLCAQRGVPAQLALESGMACGFGACFGCVVPTRDGFLRLCLDGPVLDAERLETARFPGAGH